MFARVDANYIVSKKAFCENTTKPLRCFYGI